MKGDGERRITALDYTVQRLADGVTQKRIQRELEKRGVPSDAAVQLLRSANQIRLRNLAHWGWNDLIFGCALLVFGGVVTGVSYLLAVALGVYVVAAGAILLGIAAVIRGVFRIFIGRRYAPKH